MPANKTKCLVLCSRGVTHVDRHLMLDMRQIMPHSKKDCKFDKKDSLTALNELAGLANSDKCLYFENRKGRLLLLWASNINGGPSAKFYVTGIHTMADVKLVGNCLKQARPILAFDANFDKIPHLALIKELFIQIFNVPTRKTRCRHADHVFNFSYLDGHIWFRNYQILDQETMAEVGPRMVLMPLLILSSSFHGKILWANYKKATRDKPQLKPAKKAAKRKSAPEEVPTSKGKKRKVEPESETDSDLEFESLPEDSDE